jgi:hypothetical protein
MELKALYGLSPAEKKVNTRGLVGLTNIFSMHTARERSSRVRADQVTDKNGAAVAALCEGRPDGETHSVSFRCQWKVKPRLVGRKIFQRATEEDFFSNCSSDTKTNLCGLANRTLLRECSFHALAFSLASHAGCTGEGKIVLCGKLPP